MTSRTKLLTRGVLSSLPLFIACSTGKPPSPGDDDTASVTGGSSGTATGGTSGTATGGTAATSMGGSAAAGSSGTATGGASGSAAVGGTGGDATGGGSTSVGGSGGDLMATGGDAGTAAVGGTAGAAAMSGMGGTDPGICQHLTAVATPQVPTVEILVDTSSSMFETTPSAWSVLYTALDGMDGVVKPLQDQMNFGFASYKGFKGTSETDPACATMTTVDPGPNNFAAIDAIYQQVGMSYNPASPPSPKWETPTNYAINYAVTKLLAYNPMPPGPKYILLVTDGNPNTCAEIDPQCGQDYAIKAAQDAYAAGIGLFVLGVGDIVVNGNSGCQGTGARCGADHLQDMANAGVGAPVLPAPGCDDPTSSGCQFKYAGCNVNDTLTATYTTAAPNVGVPYTVDTGATDAQTKLKAALNQLLMNAVSCTFTLDVTVTGDASLGIVTLDNMPVTYSSPDGWILESDQFHVTLQGGACETYKAGAQVSIDFPCDPSGNPIAVHR